MGCENVVAAREAELVRATKMRKKEIKRRNRVSRELVATNINALATVWGSWLRTAKRNLWQISDRIRLASAEIETLGMAPGQKEREIDFINNIRGLRKENFILLIPEDDCKHALMSYGASKGFIHFFSY